MRHLLLATLLLLLGTPGYSADSEINLLANPDGKFGVSRWTGSTTAPTVETTERGLGKSSIAWDAAGAETLTSSAASLSDYEIIKNRLCVMSAHYKGGDANLKMQVWDGSSVLKELVLETKAEWGSTGQVSFVCPTSGTLALRFEATADAAVIYLDQMFLGTRLPYNGTVVTEFEDFTPNITVGGNLFSGFNVSKFRRIGSTMQVELQGSYSGASSDTNLTLDVPGGKTPIQGVRQTRGDCQFFDASTADELYIGNDVRTTGISFRLSSAPLPSIAASDSISCSLIFEIVEWQGTSLVFQPTTDDLSLTKFQSFTPNITAGGNLFNSFSVAQYRRVGSVMHMELRWSYTGATSDTGLTIDVPNGLTPDEATRATRGSCMLFDTSGLDELYFGHDVRVAGITAQYSDPALPAIASGDTLSCSLQFEIVEWEDLGSIPAIGVEQAGVGVVGLAGPTNGGEEDPTGESCVTNCDTCAMQRLKWFRVNEIVQFSFHITINPTSANQVTECTMPQFIGLPTIDFTDFSDVNGVCGASNNTNTIQQSAVVYSSTGSDLIVFRVQDPDNLDRSFHCNGQIYLRP